MVIPRGVTHSFKDCYFPITSGEEICSIKQTEHGEMIITNEQKDFFQGIDVPFP